MKEHAILVLHGPGLADLGSDDSRHGDLTPEKIRERCAARCEQLGLTLDFRQTDDEEELLRWITEDSKEFAALIMNPAGHIKPSPGSLAAYHSAIRAAAQLKKPVVEMHMSNIFKENGEHTRPSQAPGGEAGFVCGLGLHSCTLAINAVAARLQN